MSTSPPRTPTSRDRQHSVSSTPLRRSVVDLMNQLAEIFDSYAGSPGQDAPLSALPELISAFELRRNIELLTHEEKEQLASFAATAPDQRVGVDDFLGILQAMGAGTSSIIPPQSAESQVMTDVGAPELAVEEPPFSMLNNSDESAAPSDGSPAPRRRPSSALQGRSRIPVSTTLGPSPSTPTKQLIKRRSLLSMLAASPAPNSKNSPQALTDLIAARGGTYLGVPMDGPLGEGFDAGTEAERLCAAVERPESRQEESIAVLADKTYPQIRAIDSAYQRKSEKTLLQLLEGDKALRGNVELALKGLVLGPLHFDAFLVARALAGTVRNDVLLADILVARSPADLALLRAAYRTLRQSDKAAATLDAAILSSLGANARLKKVWEVVLAGKWADVQSDDSSASAKTVVNLLKEDVDQLKVALRKGGNSEVVTKIIFARSPAHIASIIVEYRKNSPVSLTKAIKQHFSGAIKDMLLAAVETAKHGDHGLGVWRDAKAIEKTMEGKNVRSEMLTCRLTRLHWNRTRFRGILAAYQQKYSRQLVDRLLETSSGPLRDMLGAVIESASLSDPAATPADTARLEALLSTAPSSRAPSRADSMADGSSRVVKDETTMSDSDQASLLEGEGELSNPPSPRSPPQATLHDEDDDTTPQLSSVSKFEPFRAASASPPLMEESAVDKEPTTNCLSKGHRHSSSASSLSFRQRTAPLEAAGHRPGSSSGGSMDRSASSLRHSRPVAPGRRRQSQEQNGAARLSLGADGDVSGSNDSRADSPSFGSSPTPNGSFALHRRRHSGPALGDSQSSAASMDSSRSTTSSSSRPSSRQTTVPEIPMSPGSDPKSPSASIDTTSYHAPPISPVREEDLGSLEPFDLAISSSSPFSTLSRSYTIDTPESASMRRQSSSASARSFNSTHSSLFAGEGTFGFDSPGARAESMLLGGERYQSLLRHAGELQRKLKDAETRLESSSNFLEQEHSELESRLEEARAELQIKRREEKDLRGAEKQHLAQIASLESDIAKLDKKLERSRESYETMKNNYSSQCEETEKLRSLVAETRRENRAAEEAAQAHGQQVLQYERDREALQGVVNKLEAELDVARRAQDSLDEQKQENLLLKETIDRLRFDLEEMRTAARKSVLDGGDSASGSMAFGTVSKSLGRELARRLVQEEEAGPKENVDDAASGESEGEEEVDDIVVTTHRRIKKKKASSGPPTVTHLQETLVVADVEVQTDAVAVQDTEIQTDLTRIDVDKLLSVTPPAANPAKSPAELKKDLASELGVDLTAFDKFFEAQRSSNIQPVSMSTSSSMSGLHIRRAGRWATRIGSRAAVQGPALFVSAFPDSAKPYVSQVLDSSMSFFLYTATVYLIGFISGSWILPITHHHHFAPFQVAFVQGDAGYNSMSGWSDSIGLGGGFQREGMTAFIESLVWNGVSAVRRIPV